MLTQDQIDVISDAIRPLFQYLEHEVIVDIARRIYKTMTYTRTAELMAMDMQKLGYSPAKIRAEALKILNADEDYKKEVEKNTLEYKQEVKKLINNITKAAAEAGNDLIANAGNMSWVDDMSVWESAGKQLVEGSFLNQLVDAFGSQTEDQMKNLTKTTGFKSMHGYESIQNAYRHELDKAVIKICSGTFSQGKVLNDVIHDLAQSGLRSIDFESGYSMQLDTAAKLAIRTGCHQISAKIHDANIAQTGENLVYVSRHWGARNKGAGVENHELWQGKVYYIKPGQDYTEEAKRIGQDRIMDIWYSTGYSPDGSHPNNPLGLHGYSCRHIHYVFFEGISNIPKENPQPGPFRIDGKEYDYYAMTQKLRSMERNIRALKREKEALGKLGMSQTEINAKIKRKTREYREFCEKAGVPKATSNLRVESGSSDLKSTKAYQKYNDINLKNNSNVSRKDAIISTDTTYNKGTIRMIQNIEQRNVGRGNANAIAHFGIGLNNRQNRLLENLKEYDSSVVVKKKNVSMADLSALTAETGVEFAMFTKGQERLIIRGNEVSVNVTTAFAKRLKLQGYRWSGHTHPGTDDFCLMPSGGDKEILQIFNQECTAIYNSTGKWYVLEKEVE